MTCNHAANPTRTTTLVISLLAVMLMHGCAVSEVDPQVFTDYDPGTRYSSYRTFAWQTPPLVSSSPRPIASETRDFALKETATLLVAKGLQQVETAADARGRRAPAINRSVIVGLSHTGIGYDGMKNILITMNVPPPSLSCLQRNANIVGDQLIQLNRDDMRDIRGKLSQLAHSVGKETTV